MEKLDYLFTRNESNNEFTIFLFGHDFWLEQNVNFELTNDKELFVTLDNGKTYKTEQLHSSLYSSLALKNTNFVIKNQDNVSISQFTLNPLKPKSVFTINNKIKGK